MPGIVKLVAPAVLCTSNSAVLVRNPAPNPTHKKDRNLSDPRRSAVNVGVLKKEKIRKKTTKDRNPKPIQRSAFI